MHGNGNGNNEPRQFVQCSVEPGMFNGEFLAVLEAIDPSNLDKTIQIELFVDEHLVKDLSGQPSRGEPAEALLLVEVIGRKDQLTLVALPQPANLVGQRAVIRSDRILQPSP